MSFETDAKSVVKNVSFYGDVYDKSALYAEYYTHKGTVRMLTDIGSDTFKSYIRGRIRKLGLSKISAEAVIVFMRDYYTTEVFPQKILTYTRTAGSIRGRSGERPIVEYNLSNDAQQSVIVEPGGWHISNKPQHKFLTLTQILAQNTPVKSNYSLFNLMKKHVNLRGDMLKIFVLWLVQAFSLSSHFAIIVSAERGSGKSLLSRVVRALLDPSSQDITTYPDKFDDLQTILSGSYLTVLDNISDVSRKESDLLCSAITGATIAKRTLYTTNNIFSQKIHSTVVMNGISIFPEHSDFAERCLLIKMKKLTGDNIKTEFELTEEFEKDKPFILGLIFDTLSSAMNVVGTLKNVTPPRMADAYVEMMAIAIALGIKRDEFEKLYNDNVTMLEKERANTPLVEAIREYMNSPLVTGRKSSGTMNELFCKIKDGYSGDKRDLPKNASKFSACLKSERNALDVAGYTVNIDDTPSDATYIEIIKKKTRN